MDKLYAPWRDCYVQDFVKQSEPNDKKSCIFCDIFTNKITTKNRFVLYQNSNIAIMLNLYPYNGGHLLIFSANHLEQLYDVDEKIQQELMHASCISMKIVKEILQCDALNFGANIGKDGGAGIPNHVHLHVVPRWQGDTGFLPIINDTKLVSVDLETIFKQLKPAFDKAFLGKNI